jgi:YVTN family beta-propeller protein
MSVRGFLKRTGVATQIVSEIPGGKRIDIATLTPDGRHPFVTSRDTHSVIVIDTKTEKMVADIPVGKDPHGIGVRPSGGR